MDRLDKQRYYVKTSWILPEFAFVFDRIRRMNQKEKSGYKQKEK